MPTAVLQPGDTKTRFGEHQQFFVMSVDVDRTSLAQIRVEMHVTDEGLNNFNPTFLSLTYGLAIASEVGITDLIETPQDSPEAICVGADRRYDREGSMGIYTYTYEGLLKNRTLLFELELEFTMNQEPIETHPNFEVFEPKYGPYNPIDRVWPRVPTAKQAQAGGLPGGGANSAQVVTNPMFGTSSFLSPGAVFRVMFTDTEVDAEDLTGLGTKDEPDQDFLKLFPGFAEWVEQSPRDWLKLAPKIRRRGGAFQVTLEWMLSGPRGWMEDIYGDEAINHAPGTGSNDSGGTTGGEPIRSGRGPFGGVGP